MTDKEIETFEQFWDFYVGEHKEKATRILHFIGTTAAMGCVATGLLTKRRWLIAVALLAGYGPAWLSHFVIEKNKPATFKYPLWSLQADFVMWWKMVNGKMDAEVERVVRAQGERERERRSPSESGEQDVSISSEAVN
jgi:hypothetical protein